MKSNMIPLCRIIIGAQFDDVLEILVRKFCIIDSHACVVGMDHECLDVSQGVSIKTVYFLIF